MYCAIYTNACMKWFGSINDFIFFSAFIKLANAASAHHLILPSRWNIEEWMVNTAKVCLAKNALPVLAINNAHHMFTRQGRDSLSSQFGERQTKKY